MNIRFWGAGNSGKFSTRKVMNSDANVNAMAEGVVLHKKSGEGEVVQMKIVVTRGELKQVLEAMKANMVNYSEDSSSPSLYLEECINVMKRRRILRANIVKKRGILSSWRPALQTIPE